MPADTPLTQADALALLDEIVAGFPFGHYQTERVGQLRAYLAAPQPGAGPGAGRDWVDDKRAMVDAIMAINEWHKAPSAERWFRVLTAVAACAPAGEGSK